MAEFYKSRNRRQDKRQRQLRKLANMRAAKERKRLERGRLGLIEDEPKLERWHRFEFGVRDRLTGETHFVVLKSVRHAAKALGLVLKYCQ
ncbi:MAG: hypothetical protein KGL39_34090 [Patescibacteria group bacterium]|nr:hypothetical protein [Patescibacteria group bacterium]